LRAQRNPKRRRLNRRKLRRAGQQFHRIASRVLNPQKQLAAMGVQRRRRNTGLPSQNQQPGKRNHGNAPPLGQPFHRAQPHPHAGKAPRPVGDHDPAQVAEPRTGRAEQIAHGSHQHG